MKNKLAPSLLFLFVLSAMAARADEWHKSYSLTGKPQVRVDVQDGDIRVVSGNNKEVFATVTTRGWRLAPDQVRVLEHQSGNSVEIEVKVPQHSGLGTHSVKVELSVPHLADVDLHTGDGNVTAEDLQGETRLSTGDGEIVASALDGPLFAHTGDGNLRLRGRLERLDASTGDGNIDVEVAAGSKLGAGWTLKTGDGSISLRISGDLAADLDAHTGDGKITVDFPVTMSGKLDENTVRGKINGGGATLLLRSGDGNIRIEKF